MRNTLHDLAQSHLLKKQVDVAILDFSEAYDTVPKDALPSQIKHYDIDKKLWSDFLTF